MLLITGVHQRTTSRKAGPAGRPEDQWDEQTLVIADFGVTHFVIVATKDLADSLPDEGQQVTLEVAVRPYVKKSGEPGFEVRGLRHHREAAGARPTVKAV